LEEAGVVGHFDGLFHLTDFEFRFEGEGLGDVQFEVPADEFAEAGGLDGDLVFAGRELRQDEVACGVGDGLVGEAGVLIRGCDGGRGDHGARWIDDATGDRALKCLGVEQSARCYGSNAVVRNRMGLMNEG